MTASTQTPLIPDGYPDYATAAERATRRSKQAGLPAEQIPLEIRTGLYASFSKSQKALFACELRDATGASFAQVADILDVSVTYLKQTDKLRRRLSKQNIENVRTGKITINKLLNKH